MTQQQKTQMTQFKKWTKNLNRRFSKEDTQEVIGQHMKRCLTSLVIRKKQVKAAVRCFLRPVRMAIIKNTSGNKCWCEQGENLARCGRECKIDTANMENSMEDLEKIKSRATISILKYKRLRRLALVQGCKQGRAKRGEAHLSE